MTLPPPLLDTHSHMHGKPYDSDRAEVAARARAAGVERVVLIGTDPADTRLALQIAGDDAFYSVVAGLHPHDASHFSDAIIAELRDLARGHDNIVGIGEMGLDYHYDFAPRDMQRAAFLAQLDLARELSLPVVIHCREAYEDCLAILRDAPRPAASHGRAGIMHCYAGDVAQAEELVSLGWLLGIGGAVTFKNNELLRDVVRAVGPEPLVLETDAPYMTPVPFRGKRNESAHLTYVSRTVAEVLGLTDDDVRCITSRNARQIYALPDPAPDASH